ncbi:hypothetical protein ACS0TY_026841 [Phlomoides rotata]
MSKRKLETNVDVDEGERTLYAMFHNSANHLSRLYSQSIQYQKLAYEAGQSHAILELNEWLLSKMQEGRVITIADILGYLQVKMDSLNRNDGQPAQVPNGSAGMASSPVAPLYQCCFPGMAACSSAQMAECSELAAHLFSPEDPNSHLEMAGLFSSAPQGQDSFPDTQMGGI